MMKLLLAVFFTMFLSFPTDAMEIKAPEVPCAGQEAMPENTDYFGNALLELLQNTLRQLQPEIRSDIRITSGILLSAILFSLLPILTDKLKSVSSFAGAVTITSLMFQHTNMMIDCAADTVWEICAYGKLLCPVLTTGLAAQGGLTASAALYAGTMAFITFLNTIVEKLIIPMVYLFLAFSVAHCALGEETMKKIADAVRNTLNWLLKTIIVIFTTYISITGVVSGTADTAALKAAKITISSVVPVVGGILSDASESVLVSIGIMKNAAGIYGILAVLAIFLGPFLKISTQYLLLKLSSALCSLFTNKSIAMLIDDFSKAMGLLLAMVAVSSVLVLISSICFIMGMG